MSSTLFDKIIIKSKELKFKSVDILYCTLQEKQSNTTYNLFSLSIFNEKECRDNSNNTIDIGVSGKNYSIFTYRQRMNTVDFHKYISSFNGEFMESHLDKYKLFFIKPVVKNISLIDKSNFNEKFGDLFPHSVYSHYLSEIFCLNKSFFSEIRNEKIKLGEYFVKLKEKLNIDLNQFVDRIGNFLILIPENRIAAKFYGSHIDEKKLFLECFIKNDEKNDFILLLKTEDYNEVLDSLLISEITEKILIPEYNKDGKIVIEIWDQKNKMLVFRESGFLLKEIVVNMNVISGKRIVKLIDKDGREKETQIDLTSPAYSKPQKGKDIGHFIKDNEYENMKKSLLESKELFHYLNDEHEKAIRDIVDLINQDASNQVYFWDPYFTYRDMERILPFMSRLNLDIKIISDLSALKNSKEDSSYKGNSDLDFEAEIRNSIKKLSDALINNIEFRYKYGKEGFGFHDRFLIVDNNCWMLGSSFNSIGKAHSLIIKIGYPEIVIKEFLKLWNLLNNRIKL